MTKEAVFLKIYRRYKKKHRWLSNEKNIVKRLKIIWGERLRYVRTLSERERKSRQMHRALDMLPE